MLSNPWVWCRAPSDGGGGVAEAELNPCIRVSRGTHWLLHAVAQTPQVWAIAPLDKVLALKPSQGSGMWGLGGWVPSSVCAVLLPGVCHRPWRHPGHLGHPCSGQVIFLVPTQSKSSSSVLHWEEVQLAAGCTHQSN